MQNEADRATDVRLEVYQTFLVTGRAPEAAEISRKLGLSAAQVRQVLQQLDAAHVLVLHPGRDAIWMAMPFSAVPTAFRVMVGERSWWANCAWDALGIPAMLEQPAVIHTHCPISAAPLSFTISAEGPTAPHNGRIHFALPAARWWDDIGYT